MSDVNVLGDVGATLNIDTSFEVADISHLTDFTKVSRLCFRVVSSVNLSTQTLLTQESFDWEISGKNLTGISFNRSPVTSLIYTQLALWVGLQPPV